MYLVHMVHTILQIIQEFSISTALTLLVITVSWMKYHFIDPGTRMLRRRAKENSEEAPKSDQGSEARSKRGLRYTWRYA